jgi:hypothetical protein
MIIDTRSMVGVVPLRVMQGKATWARPAWWTDTSMANTKTPSPPYGEAHALAPAPVLLTVNWRGERRLWGLPLARRSST